MHLRTTRPGSERLQPYLSVTPPAATAAPQPPQPTGIQNSSETNTLLGLKIRNQLKPEQFSFVVLSVKC